ncbi:MAG TPA: molybdopterin-dependent oxidoreductase, partial [Nocardioidaceae bacterium]|nr:molybdopterin-dependent oxidoreductase [Nocardioidaceae bacterium]
MTKRILGAGSGLLAAAAGVGAGSAVAALLSGTVSPVVSVGNAVIDATPGAVKDWAVETFGENDKTVLLSSVFVVIGVLAAGVGAVGVTRRRTALGIATVLGLLALAAAFMDRTLFVDVWVAVLPAVVTLIVTVGVFALLLSALAGTAGAHTAEKAPPGFDRRRFLAVALGAGVVAAGGGLISRVYGSLEAAASRMGVRIPKPSDPVRPVPKGVQVDVPGVSPYITGNDEFYRVDTALQIPDVPAENWQLRIHGLVDDEVTLSFAELLDRRLIERRITLTCVSNQVGGDLVGNATWIGVSTKELLADIGIDPSADAVLSTSADDMTIGTPIGALTDDREAMLAIAMNGEPLPFEHGFPVRMVVPGLYGFVSATKWLVDMEVTRFRDISAYWTDRDWSEEAPIKTSSRIDVPRSFQSVPADSVHVAGMAWAQTEGITKVEVRIDDGEWQQVDLAPADTVNTWRQWSWKWQNA